MRHGDKWLRTQVFDHFDAPLPADNRVWEALRTRDGALFMQVSTRDCGNMNRINVLDTTARAAHYGKVTYRHHELRTKLVADCRKAGGKAFVILSQTDFRKNGDEYTKKIDPYHVYPVLEFIDGEDGAVFVRASPNLISEEERLGFAFT